MVKKKFQKFDKKEKTKGKKDIIRLNIKELAGWYHDNKEEIDFLRENDKESLNNEVGEKLKDLYVSLVKNNHKPGVKRIETLINRYNHNTGNIKESKTHVNFLNKKQFETLKKVVQVRLVELKQGGGNNIKIARKHRGIVQIGGNKGRLRKGYKFSGKKLKSGLPQIIKCVIKI